MEKMAHSETRKSLRSNINLGFKMPQIASLMISDDYEDSKWDVYDAYVQTLHRTPGYTSIKFLADALEISISDSLPRSIR